MREDVWVNLNGSSVGGTIRVHYGKEGKRGEDDCEPIT